jgi:hypothetical protein
MDGIGKSGHRLRGHGLSSAGFIELPAHVSLRHLPGQCSVRRNACLSIRVGDARMPNIRSAISTVVNYFTGYSAAVPRTHSSLLRLSRQCRRAVVMAVRCPLDANPAGLIGKFHPDPSLDVPCLDVYPPVGEGYGTPVGSRNRRCRCPLVPAPVAGRVLADTGIQCRGRRSSPWASRPVVQLLQRAELLLPAGFSAVHIQSVNRRGNMLWTRHDRLRRPQFNLVLSAGVELLRHRQPVLLEWGDIGIIRFKLMPP